MRIRIPITGLLPVVLICTSAVFGQSGATPNASGGSATTTASATSPANNRANPPVAMNGYCPVSILATRRWVKGDSNIAVILDGKLYLFPSQKEKEMYLKNPVKYTPALGGDCIVCAVKGVARHPGSIHYSAIHHERLFLFPSEEEKAEFMVDPDKYAEKDLAFEGKCIVSKVDLGKDVVGQQEFGTIYGGIRFLFTSLDHRKAFLANPGKYFQQQ